MKFLRRSCLVLAILVAAAIPAFAAPQSGDALLRRMADANPSLRTYTASMHVVIVMHSMPFVSPALDASYYYKRPDKQAVVFQTVPLLAEQFQKVYPKLDPPATWPQLYDISVLDESPASTTLRLVPKRQGRVSHLDVVVDNSNAMPTAFTWAYVDGGSVEFQQQYTVIGGSYLIKSQNGRVELPSYNADVTSTFSDFKLNVPIPDSVFSG